MKLRYILAAIALAWLASIPIGWTLAQPLAARMSGPLTAIVDVRTYDGTVTYQCQVSALQIAHPYAYLDCLIEGDGVFRGGFDR